MSVNELHLRAQSLRQLAAKAEDEVVKGELLYLAAEYEAAARSGAEPGTDIPPTTFPD